MMTFDAMEQLNFERYSFKIKNRENKPYIFDIIRKKEVVLTPEEWVRQNFISYLTNYLDYPLSLMLVEKEIKLNDLKKRFDLACVNTQGEIFLLAEFKSFTQEFLFHSTEVV